MTGDVDVVALLQVGEVTFMGVTLHVRDGVLVARPETELLGSEAVRALRAMGGRRRVVDVCCGSGNLACGIAAQAPTAEVFAVDLTLPCVDLARHNAQRLGLEIDVRQGDLLAPVAEELAGTVDLIVCNPPYISTGKLEQDKAELLRREPREAFDGGPYGIAIHARVVHDALPLLKSGGYLMMEVGVRQEKQVTRLLQRTGGYRDIRLVPDGNGVPRVAVAQKI